jgi:beta-glucosidase
MVGRSSADIRLTVPLRVDGETVPRRAATAETRAADFDDYDSVALVDETRRSGDAVAPVRETGWILFRDVDLGAGAGRLEARVSRAGAGAAMVRVRLDDPVTGALIGTLVAPGTGDRYAWTLASAALDGAAGVHDLYIVFEGEAALATFRFV